MFKKPRQNKGKHKGCHIGHDALSEKTGKSRRTISRIITELKTTGTLARVGSDKSGHWEINQ